jgi:magnesium transporter
VKNTLLLPELRELVSLGRFEDLREFCTAEHPGVIAEFLSALDPEEVWVVLRTTPSAVRAEIFSHLDEEVQVEATEFIGRREMTDLVSHMSPDDRVDFLKRLPEEKAAAVLPALAQVEREDIRRLSSYPEGTAGAVMTSDYATLGPDLNVDQAIEKLRREAPDRETIYVAYVVDEKRQLLGLVSLRDLMVSRGSAMVRNIMKEEVVSVLASESREEGALKIQKYDLIALPVIDGDQALVGILTHDDAMDVMSDKFSEDMGRFMAIAGTSHERDYLRTSPWEHFRNRSGWIVALALLGLVSGYIIQAFEGVLLQFALLATFIPMLAGAGGNTGGQSATLVVRALATGELLPRNVLGVLWREFRVSLLLGGLLALLAFGRVLLFSRHGHLPPGFSPYVVGAAVAAALGFQVVTSTLLGALLPLAAARARFDPALVASPALASIVDITGLTIYFITVKIVLRL